MNPASDLREFGTPLIIILVFWVGLSALFFFSARRFLAMIMRNRIHFSSPVIWLYRILGFVNMVGAIYLLCRIRS